MRKRKKLYIVVLVLLLPVLFWLADLGRCELLTHLHADELRPAMETSLFPGEEIRKLKVLGYSAKSKAKVYMVDYQPDENYPGGGFEEGRVYRLEWQNDRWEITLNGEYGWSGAGSADDPVLPYFFGG